MRRIPALVLIALLLSATAALASSQAPADSPEPPADAMDRILDEVRVDDHPVDRLRELCDVIGPRLSGSENMDRGIAWAVEYLRAYGLDDVREEPVMVPHWERGKESAEVIEPWPMPLAMSGLGGSVGTPPGGIEADVMVVTDFDELEARADEARGRIVLFNPPWQGYGPTVQYRVRGADAAARHGAVACLIRSVTHADRGAPHTGVMRYAGDDTIPRIPAAAITVADAARLERQHRRGLPVRVRLEMGAQWHPDVQQANVVADLIGREKPDEIVLVSGHFDSWDVGCGAHDDGAACIMAMEVARQLVKMDLRPRRTVRVVLWIDEEMTQTGAKAYMAAHADEIDKHVVAIESDSGCFAPAGWSVRGRDEALAEVSRLAAELESLGAGSARPGWAGVDVRPLNEAGVPGIGHRVHNEDYFLYHHSADDTFDKVDPEDLKANAAVLTALVWMLAEMEGELPRASVD